MQPRKKKKPFIEKKKAVTFHLVHRSQRDPLAADDAAPQRVLLPARRVSRCLSCLVRPRGRSYGEKSGTIPKRSLREGST